MLLNYVRVQLISSDVAHRLQYINDRGYILRDVHQTDLLTVCFTIGHKDYWEILPYLEEKGDGITVLRTYGLRRVLARAAKRPVLGIITLLIFILTLWIPSKALFFRVEGNESIPTQQILQCAEIAGVRFGCDVRSLRSEKIKNSLLQQIQGLSWAGINTKGCVATISVVERQDVSQTDAEEFTVGSIVACHDAQITQITATAGNPLCKPGDVVSKGQVLISAYTDCGIKIQATQAKGEVFGNTVYHKNLVLPAEYRVKTSIIDKNQNIFLQIGKKEIKICKGSGISGSICDKMYSQKYLTLPGGFVLPLGIRVETCIYYRPSNITLPAQKAQAIMEHQARDDLICGMVSGQIDAQTLDFSQGDGIYCLSGRYVCREMIGRIQYEKIGAYHEQISGKNRQRG